MNEIGEVLWHSLDRNGNTKFYDILWESGNLEQDIDIRELKAVNVQEHKHIGTEEAKKPMPSGLGFSMGPGMSINVSEDKKMKLDQKTLRRIILEELTLIINKEKKHKKTKSDPQKDFLYPYAYGIGRRRDYEEDEDDIQLDDYVFGDAGDMGGGGEGGGGE